MVMTGSVARFDARRGYGFLIPDDGGEDVFVHQNNIEMEGFRFLNPGERVQFDIEEGLRGRKAVSVGLLEQREERPRRNDRPERGNDRPERGNDRGYDRGARDDQRGGGNSGRPQPRGGNRNDRPPADDGRLLGEIDKLRRRQERLINILVEKGILAPGEIDRLPGLEEVSQTASLDGDYDDEDEDEGLDED
jgi:cold shock CspA family protein